MISILNYGLGNIASVANMIQKVGGQSLICNDPAALYDAKKILLPGVGAFDHGMEMLHNGGWIEALNVVALEKQIPILGICLGMQLMCKSSEEGSLAGLGWIDAEVIRFNLPEYTECKIPHMGWNPVEVVKLNPLIESNTIQQRFYFVHSYHVVCNHLDDVIACAHHGYNFTSAFNRSNLFGVQFHPEKSHRFGMAFMKKFIELPC